MGAGASYFFQTRSSARTERFAREQQRRTERVAAYSAFASAATELRRAQYDRWHRKNEDPAGQPAKAARVEAFRLRGVIQHAYFVVQLLTPSSKTAELARAAYEACASIHKADSKDDLSARGNAAEQALSEFIVGASAEIDRP